MGLDNSFAMFLRIASINHTPTHCDLLGPVPLQRAQWLPGTLKLYKKRNALGTYEELVRLARRAHPIQLKMQVIQCLCV